MAYSLSPVLTWRGWYKWAYPKGSLFVAVCSCRWRDHDTAVSGPWGFYGLNGLEAYTGNLITAYPPFLSTTAHYSTSSILKHNNDLCHVIHILDDFFIAEHTKIDCLGSFATLVNVLCPVEFPLSPRRPWGLRFLRSSFSGGLHFRGLRFLGHAMGSSFLSLRLPRGLRDLRFRGVVGLRDF